MDDLFRKAAEQYPLKTEGADWQKIAAGLGAASMPAAEEKEKRRRGVLWLLLLLPLALLWAVHYEGDNRPVQQEADGTVRAESSHSSAQKPDVAITEKPSLKKEDTDNTAPSFSSDGTSNHLNTSIINDNSISSVHHDKESLTKERRKALQAGGSVRSDNKDNPGYQQTVMSNKTVAPGDDKNNFSALQPDASFNRIDREDEQKNRDDEVVDQSIQNKTDSIAFNDTKRDSSASNKDGSENKKKLVKVKPHVQTGFYVGLLANFDLSTVKLQRINKTGYGWQVLAGYRFSKRLSIETGLGWSLKKYYSKGKYFDKKNAKIPDAVNIYFSNGNCKMLEVPLSVKYDFALRKNSNLFITAGLSSYFMKKENYSYTGDYMGWVYDTTRHYSNSGNNLFSVASLSVGYQLQLNKHLSLRAEPYIKMPLHGIGIAKMPITSTGITVGFTRSF